MDFKSTIELVGTIFDLVGVGALAIGALIAVVRYGAAIIRRGGNSQLAYQNLRRDMGKAILLGLELLVAADIIRSVAVDPTFASLGVLGLLVVIRTFLSWSLEVELNGEWPWRKARSRALGSTGADEL
jgi:uncharacterized membrane protein